MPYLSSFFFFSWCFTSTEDVLLIRNRGKEWDREREPRPTSLFTQLLGPETLFECSINIYTKRDHVASDLSSFSCCSHVGSLCTCNLKTVLDSVCPYFDLESDIKST